MRWVSLVAAVIAGLASDAFGQAPVITSASAGGLGSVVINVTSSGIDADLGSWSGVPANAGAVETLGCQYVNVDINVNGGGVLKFTYRQKAWGGTWYPEIGTGSPDQDYLDVYVLTPGTSWNPGNTWNESGTERCFRQDWPPGVIPLVQKFEFRNYFPLCDGGVFSCLRESQEVNFSLDLERWKNRTIRVVFRQWLDGVGDETQSSIRNLGVEGCPVTPLRNPPFADPLAQTFEGSPAARRNTANLQPYMQTALTCLQAEIIADGGMFPADALSSAYRPREYQLHMREVWDKNILLRRNNTAVCASLKSQVTAEMGPFPGHDLKVQPAGAGSRHLTGDAIDLSVGLTGLSEARVVQLAQKCSLVRSVEGDNVHFTHVDHPR
jgi:hypothetical protein